MADPERDNKGRPSSIKKAERKVDILEKEGKVKLVSQMSAREHRMKKKRRENTRKSREIKAARNIVEITSSFSPEESQVYRENESCSTSMCPAKPISRCTLIGRKKILNNRSKVTRQLKKSGTRTVDNKADS
ncbi:hypothetical protein JTE90_027154 [Oedothorax gibbosus]|uniref:Uncharacterized protein n=1 Tax=Oedothorax gibbosus TaxID=931172 RepID=A0AAV6TXR8_9ARAC|nr:hypothetical protein JTE90_027154 [Oedothorax gibbosus]